MTTGTDDITMVEVQQRLEAMCGTQDDDNPMLTVHRRAPTRWVAYVHGVKRGAARATPWTSRECVTLEAAIRDLLWPSG